MTEIYHLNGKNYLRARPGDIGKPAIFGDGGFEDAKHDQGQYKIKGIEGDGAAFFDGVVEWADAYVEIPDDTPQETYGPSHSSMVTALIKSGRTIAEEMTAEDAHLIHMAVGVSGEAGELLDAVKKSVIYRKPLDVENVIEELGDLEFYMEGLRQGLGLTREQCLEANIKKLSKRYGEKYTDAAAHARADKEPS
jgi:NTP pyrophosphatase (non-canonical NTP hydrolase)